MDKKLENVLISSDGIKNALKRYKPHNSIAEYVWNGFDANANTVDIILHHNELGSLSSIEVIDNGYGIDRSWLDEKFRPFYQSEKIYDPQIHGKNGVGRLTFFSFSSDAVWTTVYKKENKTYEYSIGINSNSLQSYDPEEEKEVSKFAGTKVILYNINTNELSEQTIKEYLALEFCWFLELNKEKGYMITVNGNKLDYDSLIVNLVDKEFSSTEPDVSFNVRLVSWSKKLHNEYSKYYYIKSDGNALGKENTTFNNKGDQFYHSVFIKSELFDNFDLDRTDETLSLFATKQKSSEEFQYLFNKTNQMILDMRRPFLKANVSQIIENFEIETAFPNYNKNNAYDVFKKSQIEDLIESIYLAQPKVFSGGLNKEQKKTFIRLLDLTMQSGEVDSLYNILEEILDMNSYEREELADILKYTNMSNVTRTIKLIRDRYQAISDFKQLIFNKNLGANEVDHVQSFVENHYWIFGEEHALVTAAEPSFEEALKRYQYILHKEYENTTIDHLDRLKEMDIFAVRQDIKSNRCDNIVVELKHPNIPLGEEQLSQVKRYMSVISETPEFNNPGAAWKFYLVGNRLNKNGYIQREIENNKNYGEQSLVYSVGNIKIFVKTWSEIFDDFEVNYNHLTRALELEREKLQKEYKTADEIIKNQTTNAAVMPAEISIEQ